MKNKKLILIGTGIAGLAAIVVGCRFSASLPSGNSFSMNIGAPTTAMPMNINKMAPPQAEKNMFSAATAYQLFPESTRGLIYMDMNAAQPFMAFASPRFFPLADSKISQFCLANKVKFYGALCDMDGKAAIDCMLIQAECSLDDVRRLIDDLNLLEHENDSILYANKRISVSKNNSAAESWSITEIAGHLFLWQRETTMFMRCNVPEALKNKFDLQILSSGSRDNIFLLTAMGQYDDYKVKLTEAEPTADDYTMQIKLYELELAPDGLQKSYNFDFSLTNITDPEHETFCKPSSEMATHVWGKLDCEYLLSVEQGESWRHSMECGKSSFSFSVRLPESSVLQLSELQLSQTAPDGGLKARAIQNTKQLYSSQFFYYGDYENVREPELGMRLAASENGRRFLQEFADKCANILLSGQINPDESATGAAYQKSYDFNDADTPEQKIRFATSFLMADVMAANSFLKTPEKSVALFKELAAAQPQTAKNVWPVIRNIVMENGDFALAAEYYPEPVAVFNDVCSQYQTKLKDSMSAIMINLYRQEFNRSAGNLLKLAEYQKNSAAVQQIKDGIKQFNADADESISQL